MKVTPVTLEGNRVLVCPMRIDHLEGLYNIGRDQEIWTYMSSVVQTKEDMRGIIEKALNAQKNGTQLPFAVVDKATQTLVGSTSYLDIQSHDRSLEIGSTWYSPEVWRTGVNTETKFLLLRHAFEDLGVIRVQFKTHHLNVRSQAAIERIGAVKEGVLRNHRILADGSIRHSVYYSILDSEWPTVKPLFENKLLKRDKSAG